MAETACDLLHRDRKIIGQKAHSEHPLQQFSEAVVEVLHAGNAPSVEKIFFQVGQRCFAYFLDSITFSLKLNGSRIQFTELQFKSHLHARDRPIHRNSMELITEVAVHGHLARDFDSVSERFWNRIRQSLLDFEVGSLKRFPIKTVRRA